MREHGSHRRLISTSYIVRSAMIDERFGRGSNLNGLATVGRPDHTPESESYLAMGDNVIFRRPCLFYMEKH